MLEGHGGRHQVRAGDEDRRCADRLDTILSTAKFIAHQVSVGGHDIEAGKVLG